MAIFSRLYAAKGIQLVLGLYCGMCAFNASAKVPVYSPYQQVKSNLLYNRLFCDSVSNYRKFEKHNNILARTVLSMKPPTTKGLTRLVQSTSASSCQKLLAYNLLRQQNISLQQKTRLLGVVVEVAFDNGMDTLAAYRDGHVYYIHRDGKVQTIKKDGMGLTAKVHKLFQEAQLVVENTQYWPKQRLGPPSAGQVRLSFLASDGIHFGEGSMNQLELNPLAGPVLTAATELLVKLLNN